MENSKNGLCFRPASLCEAFEGDNWAASDIMDMFLRVLNDLTPSDTTFRKYSLLAVALNLC